jgi:hypothetical protein
MHIYGQLLHSYVKRDLPEWQLARLDEHVTNCLSCAHALADEGSAAAGWERRGFLGRLVQATRPETAAAAEAELREARAA